MPRLRNIKFAVASPPPPDTWYVLKLSIVLTLTETDHCARMSLCIVHKVATANACSLLHELKPFFYCGSTSVLPNLFLLIVHVANETYVQHQAINRKDHSWLEIMCAQVGGHPESTWDEITQYLFWKLGSKFLQSIKR